MLGMTIFLIKSKGLGKMKYFPDTNIFCSIALMNVTMQQGSKEGPSGRPGQVDSPSGQVSFHPHLLNGQGIRQVICQLSHQNSKLRLAQGKQNSRAT